LRLQMKDLESSFDDYKVLVNKTQRREKVLRLILILGLIGSGIALAMK
jgi:hypothetical protein